MADTDYFLKINGIDGESTDSKHKGEIELESWSWGATNNGDHGSGTGGGGAGRVSMQDVHFTSKMSTASPKLMLYCATGQHIADATLTCRKAGTDQQEYLKVKLSDLIVSSYQTGGSGGSGLIPSDQFSFNFAKIEFTYQAQDAKGAVGKPAVAGWDRSANKKV